MKLKDLRTRALFALWAIPLAWFIVNATNDLSTLIPFVDSTLVKPIYPVYILDILLIVLALKEYNSMLAHEYEKNGFWLSYLWLVPALLSFFLHRQIFPFSMQAFLLLMIVAAEVFFIGKGTDRWKRASLMFCGTMFLYLAGEGMFKLQASEYVSIWKWSFPEGTIFNSNLGFIFLCAAVFLSDTMAYFTGSLFGKHHFSTTSPKKTVEGAVGGLAASILTMTLALLFLRSETTPFILGPILGLAIGLAAQAGDLLVSSMKRYFNVKDASHLIPGHGGILDRFDSIFFAVPVLHIVITIFNQVR